MKSTNCQILIVIISSILLISCNEEIKMAAAATGSENVHEMQADDLRALYETVSKMTGIRMPGISCSPDNDPYA